MRASVTIGLLSLALLASCAQEKGRSTFGKDNKTTVQPCSSGYAPIFLNREGQVSLSNPALISEGRYVVTGIELLVQEDMNDRSLQGHFLEEVTDTAVRRQTICTQVPSRDLISEAVFPGISEFIQTAEGARSHTPLTFLVQVERGNARMTKGAPGPVVSSDIGPVLRQWRNWRIYQLNSTSLEIRAETVDLSGPNLVKKFMVLNFRRYPL